MDHETYREWLDLAVDAMPGGPDPLGATERRELETHLAACAECRAERARLERVGERLAAARRDVRPGFGADVMAALGTAPWEAQPRRSARVWRGPFALLVGLGAASAALRGTSGASLEPAGGASGALAALVEMARAALLAGSGLAGATWAGVGAALADWLGASPVRWIAAAVGVTALNLLAVRLARAESRGGAPTPPRTR